MWFVRFLRKSFPLSRSRKLQHSTVDGRRGFELGRHIMLPDVARLPTYHEFLPPRERDRDVQRRRTFFFASTYYILRKLLGGDIIRSALAVRS